MNILELSKATALENHWSVRDTTIKLKALLRGIGHALKSGPVSLSKFGTFRVTVHPEKQGHNPKTLEKLVIPPSIRILFQPSPVLKRRLL